LVELAGQRLITAMTWMESTLVIGTDSGEIWQITADGDQSILARLGSFVVSIATDGEAIYAAAGSGPRRLVRFPIATPQDLEDLVEPGSVGDVNHIAWAGTTLYLTDFHKGRVLALRSLALHVVADGLSNPCCLACAADGTLYVAEFGRGAVTRILP
jgi:hypothetical protein